MLAVTVTVKVSVEVKKPSLACSVKVALVALQDATTSAVTVPAVLTIFEIVTPLDGFALVTVTTTEPGPVSASLTVAMVGLEAAFWRSGCFSAVLSFGVSVCGVGGSGAHYPCCVLLSSAVFAFPVGGVWVSESIVSACARLVWGAGSAVGGGQSADRVSSCCSWRWSPHRVPEDRSSSPDRNSHARTSLCRSP